MSDPTSNVPEAAVAIATDGTEANRMAARRAFLRGGLAALPAVVTLTGPLSAAAQTVASVNCFTRVSTNLASTLSVTPPSSPTQEIGFTGTTLQNAKNLLPAGAPLNQHTTWGTFVSEFTGSSACALSVAAIMSHRHTDFV